MKIEELGGFIPDVTEAVLPGMIFQPHLIARPLGSSAHREAPALESEHVASSSSLIFLLALGPATGRDLFPNLQVRLGLFAILLLPACSMLPSFILALTKLEMMCCGSGRRMFVPFTELKLLEDLL